MKLSIRRTELMNNLLQAADGTISFYPPNSPERPFSLN
jgi:hypothetical protein